MRPCMVTQIVGRCHVGQSNRSVIRYFVSRLKSGYATWRTLNRKDRKQWLLWIITEHAENRATYRYVMGGAR